MIRKSSEQAREVREQMRGGKGCVNLTHLFSKEEMLGKARLCSVITLNPGCSIGLHDHVNEEEIYYIIKGKGVIDDNGAKREVETGDAILTGGGASHSVESTGDEPLVIFAIILV